MQMRRYPYSGRNLFTEPETYQFASCRSLGFFEGWKTYRREKLAALRERSEAGISEEHGVWRDAPLGIPLTAIIDDFRGGRTPGALGSTDPKAVIDSLTQKFEIFRRLFAAYKPNLLRAKEAPEASLAEYVAFGHALADAADRYGGPKYLSTLLKLSDALCSLPESDYDRNTARSLADLLVREGDLVKKWTRLVDDDAIA